MNSPMVSVIVPVYNSEKYLSRCIESILNQTYDNIELILINDGSNDQSGKICDQYANKYNHIIVIHKKNSGVSDSRNEGIKISSGEYLQFVDSDDYIDENMIELLIRAIKQDDSDLIICGYKRKGSIMGITEISFNQSRTFSYNQFIKIFDNLYLKYLINPPWNKLYKAKIIKDNRIYFDSYFDLGEDLLFNIEVIKKSNIFSIDSSCPYCYIQYQGNSSLATKGRADIYIIQKLLYEKVITLYSNPLKYSTQIKKVQMEYARTIAISVALHIATQSELKKINTYLEIMKTIRKDEVVNKLINSLELQSKQEKIIALFFYNNMYICIWIYAKTKLFIKQRIPLIFSILRRWGVR